MRLRIARPSARVRIVALALVATAFGFAMGAAKWRGSAQAFHREARLQAILDHASQMKPGGVLVLGDSATEFNRFEELCGRPALNAGIAWSTTADWLPDAKRVMAVARPSLVVLAIGTNEKDDESWRADFRALAQGTGAVFAVRPRKASVGDFIATVLPVVPPPTTYRDDKHPDAAGAAEWRANIERGCRDITPMRRANTR